MWNGPVDRLKSATDRFSVPPMRKLRAFLILLLVGIGAVANARDDVVPVLAADEFVTIRDVAYQDGNVTGVAENRSDMLLRDVKLRINCSWRWTDEFNPGEDDMSWGAVHALGEIPPKGEATFRQEPPRPMPARSDGRYHVEVTVAGLTRVRIIEDSRPPAEAVPPAPESAASGGVR